MKNSVSASSGSTSNRKARAVLVRNDGVRLPLVSAAGLLICPKIVSDGNPSDLLITNHRQIVKVLLVNIARLYCSLFEASVLKLRE